MLLSRALYFTMFNIIEDDDVINLLFALRINTEFAYYIEMPPIDCEGRA